MNRNNIWIHIGLAVVLLSMAAVLGQIERWKGALRSNKDLTRTERNVKVDKLESRAVPEVLVRFKPGVSLDRIRAIAATNHDRLNDEIESVSGLSVIDDLDNVEAETVAAQYRAMSEVAYAESNFEIRLDRLVDSKGRQLKENGERYLEGPNDPMFGDQWALNNPSKDGLARADVDAILAWTKSKGSLDVVVAVLDSGVEYTHEDLV